MDIENEVEFKLRKIEVQVRICIFIPQLQMVAISKPFE